MKILLLAILALGAILIRLSGGSSGSEARRPARSKFLMAIGLITLGIIFVWFWFVMR